MILLRSLLQDAFMIPIHALEGLAVRFEFARSLYALMAPPYNFVRKPCYFGEDVLLREVESTHKVLDLGCGSGIVSRRAFGKAAEVVGVDLDPSMLRKAESIEAKRKGPGPLYFKADLTSLPFGDESFDSCVSLGALHCVPADKVCREAQRVLRPGGTFSVVNDFRIIPFFNPPSSAAIFKAGLEEAGFGDIEEIEIGRLYRCIRGRKKTGNQTASSR